MTTISASSVGMLDPRRLVTVAEPEDDASPRPRLNARGAVVGEAALPIRFRLAAAPPPPPPSFVPGGLFVCRYAAALVIGTMAIGTGVSEIKARTERA